MSQTNSTTSKFRGVYNIQNSRVAKILCHRLKGGREQYLVEWRTEPGLSKASNAICSWHDLDELQQILHYVQTYVETTRHNFAQRTPNGGPLLPLNRKRKLTSEDPKTTRDLGLGIISPGSTSTQSRSPCAVSRSSSEIVDGDTKIYNGILEKKEGCIVAKMSQRPQVATIDATTLPTLRMKQEAASTPVKEAERHIREAFYAKLKAVRKLKLENKIDTSTPSLDFTFVKDYVLRDDVYRADPETYEGCQKPCRRDMGQGIGCEYPQKCTCLEYAAVNEESLKRIDPKLYERYMEQKQMNVVVDTTGLPKRFPYHKPNDDERVPQRLQKFYLDSRHPIYECNINCNCGPVCKSRVVQKGRKVPLTIFKTPGRGWGVYCSEALVQGEFIDTYLGEIVTNGEADRREENSGKADKASYLYSLDKFNREDDELTSDNCFVVDGQYMGGPTRFINHSCEPNCRQYTVSYNKHDLRIYDLAFFAIENVPAGTELVFDYMDKDEEEEEDVLRKREQAAKDPSNSDKLPCNCGARKCRGYLWV